MFLISYLHDMNLLVSDDTHLHHLDTRTLLAMSRYIEIRSGLCAYLLYD